MTAAAAPLRSSLRAERGRLLISISQLAPALIYFALFYVGPLLVLLYISFLTNRNFQYVEPLTFDRYAEVAESDSMVSETVCELANLVI